MEILVNHQKVDFALEDEATLVDVVEAMTGWAQERGLLLVSVLVDDEPFLIDQLPDLALDAVEILDCIIQSKADIVFATADEAARYADRIIRFIEETRKSEADEIDTENLLHLVSGITWLVDVMEHITGLLQLDTGSVKYGDMTVDELFTRLRGVANRVEQETSWEAVKPVLESESGLFPKIPGLLKMFITGSEMKQLVVDSIDSPDVLLESLKNILEELPVQVVNLEQIAVLFQEGKDGEASERLGHFVDYVYRYTRFCHQIIPVFNIDPASVLVNDVSLETKNGIIQQQLTEILDVMENDDIVSLTDILEYEMKDSIAQTEAYLLEIKNIIMH